VGRSSGQGTRATMAAEGVVFTALIYVSGYLFLLFVAVCLACGLYYMAELAEEYTQLTRRLMSATIMAVLVVHGLLFLLERLPSLALAVGAGTHVSYMWQMQSFPRLYVCSLPFLTSLALLCASHYLWVSHFFAHYHQVTHVLCFFLFNVWLVPFGFFVSLSVDENTLPDRQAASAEDMYSEGGTRTKQKSGILSAFAFLGQKRDEAMPALAKKV